MWHSDVAHPCGTSSKVTAIDTCHVPHERSNFGSLAMAAVLNDLAQQTKWQARNAVAGCQAVVALTVFHYVEQVSMRFRDQDCQHGCGGLQTAIQRGRAV